MSALTTGPLAYLGRQFEDWRKAHRYAKGMVWDAAVAPPGAKPRCEFCKLPAHGAYVWPAR